MTSHGKTLHIDVTQGCTGEVVIGSLAALVGNIACVKEGFLQCGISIIEPFMIERKSKTLFGTSLEFRSNNGPITTHSECNGHFTPPKRKNLFKPIWAKRSKPSKGAEHPQEKNTQNPQLEEPISNTSTTDILLGYWLRQNHGTLEELGDVLSQSTLNPIPKALALKVVEILNKHAHQVVQDTKVELPGIELVRFLCEIISFVKLLESISPSSVTSTFIAHSQSPTHVEDGITIDRYEWLLALTSDVPVYDRLWPAPFADPVGVAFLRAVVSRFGPRGHSTLKQSGLGLASKISGPELKARILLCEAEEIASRPSLSFQAFTTATLLTEVTATIGLAINIPDLLNRLKSLGMKSVQTWQVFESATQPRLLLRGIVKNTDAALAIEALLVTGEANEVYTNLVESQALEKRVVAVPYGREQKRQVCKVNEWLMSGRVVRAEPDEHDLLKLIKNTGHPQEVVRSDILASWRKLRVD